jgi:DNA-binding response OmpR family regulator
MKLLLIEDNRQLAHWLAKTLTDEGFVVDHVLDGEAAVASWADTRYDVVLLDLNLPGMSGKAVLRRLRDEANDTPVLVLTATGDIGEKVICLSDGADDLRRQALRRPRTRRAHQGAGAPPCAGAVQPHPLRHPAVRHGPPAVLHW